MYFTRLIILHSIYYMHVQRITVGWGEIPPPFEYYFLIHSYTQIHYVELQTLY